MKKQKTQLTSFLLTLSLGPFGLFYSSPVAALGLVLFAIVSLIFTNQVVLFFVAWPISIIIGFWAVAKHDKIIDHHNNVQSTLDHDNTVTQINTQAIVDQDTKNNQSVSIKEDKIPRHTHTTGQIIEIEGQRLGIIDLGTDLSFELQSYIDKNILRHGEPFVSGGKLSSSCLLGVAGATSAASASLLAGNIFVSTASPSALSMITSATGAIGYGTMIKGAGGTIIAHAPFIPAAGAIIPVVAPVVLFMTMVSIMMSARFDQIQISLDQLAIAVKQLLRREIVGDYGLLLSAIERFRDISDEFEESRLFTDEMKMRLVLVEKDANILHQKYNILANPDNRIESIEEASLTIPDLNLFILSSLADIQVDRLRLKLALQDNPDDADRSLRMLKSKINRYAELFEYILENDSVDKYKKELQDFLDGMNWWQKNISQNARKEKAEGKIEKLDEIDELRAGTIQQLSQWSQDLNKTWQDSGGKHSIIYYRDKNETGELKAYYTSDLLIEKHFHK